MRLRFKYGLRFYAELWKMPRVGGYGNGAVDDVARDYEYGGSNIGRKNGGKYQGCLCVKFCYNAPARNREESKWQI